VSEPDIGVVFEDAGDGLTGAVTARLTLTFSRRGAGPNGGLREERRRGTSIAWSVCCC
jgi:hypothetical protein